MSGKGKVLANRILRRCRSMADIGQEFVKFLNIWEKDRPYCQAVVEKMISGELEIKDIYIDIDENEKFLFAAFLLALHYYETEHPKKVLCFLQDLNEQEPVIRLLDYSDRIGMVALLILLKSETLLNSFIKEIEEMPEEKAFTYLHEIYSAFPYLNISEKQTLVILRYLARSHQDGLFGETVKSVESWAEKHPEHVSYVLRELVATLDSATTEYIEPAIIGLAKTDFEQAELQATELLENPKTQYIYLWIKYRFAKIINCGFDRVLSLAVEFCGKEEENNVSMAISVLVQLLEEMPENNIAVIQELHKILEKDKRPLVLYRLVRQLHCSNNKTIAFDFLPYLLEVSEDHKGITDYLDWVLTELIPIDIQQVISFLENWITRHHQQKERTHTLFDSCFQKLAKQDKFLFVLCRWFISIDKSLSSEAVSIFVEFNINSFHPTVIQNWSNEEIATCIFRLHRLVKLSGESCAHLTYSLLLYGDAEKLKIYLINDLKYYAKNYPGYTNEILAAKKADLPPDTRLILESVIDWLKNYHSARKVTFNYKELYPDPERITLINKINASKMAEQMAQIYDDDQFPLLKLTTQVSLARGAQWFHKTDEGFCEPANLSTMSQSYEYPQMEFIDPELSALRHLTWFKKKGWEEE
jgi:hypothetical protein